MPRVSLTTTRFTVDGVEYEAAFGHQAQRVEYRPFKGAPRTQIEAIFRNGKRNNGARGNPWRTKEGHRIVKRREYLAEVVTPLKAPDGTLCSNITTCVLRAEGAGGIAKGAAYCDIRDKYDWRTGCQKALSACLAELGIERYISQGDGAAGARNPKWGKFMSAFFEELGTPMVSR